MAWIGGAIAGGGALLGSLISSDAASNAADQQSKATDAAIAEQRRQSDLNRSDLAPFTQTGQNANRYLSQIMGIGGDNTASDFGNLRKKFTLADFWNDPVTQASYQSGLDLGAKGINNMAASRGSLNSGGTLKALTRFGTDYTGGQAAASRDRFIGDQTNEYNRIAGLGAGGQTAATQSATMGQGSANNISNLLSAQGNARGAATIAGGNAIGGAATNIGNWWNQQNMLDKFLTAKYPSASDGTGYGSWAQGDTIDRGY